MRQCETVFEPGGYIKEMRDLHGGGVDRAVGGQGTIKTGRDGGVKMEVW